VLSLDVLSFDVLSLDVLSFDVLSLDVLSFDVLSLDVLSPVQEIEDVLRHCCKTLSQDTVLRLCLKSPS